VTARHAASGQVVTRVTDAAGRFFLPALRPGQWEITASSAGFAPQTHKDLELELGRTLNVDFKLGVEGVAESVTVAAGAALLQTTTAEISDIIDPREVVVPAERTNSGAGGDHAVVIPPGGCAAMRSSRRSAAERRWTTIGPQHYPLDGAKVTDELFNNLGSTPVDRSEFKIQKSMYPASSAGRRRR
jgi:hypothetical protein